MAELKFMGQPLAVPTTEEEVALLGEMLQTVSNELTAAAEQSMAANSESLMMGEVLARLHDTLELESRASEPGRAALARELLAQLGQAEELESEAFFDTVASEKLYDLKGLLQPQVMYQGAYLHELIDYLVEGSGGHEH